MRLGSRSPEHKCSVHNIWLEKVGEVDGVEQLCCPACLYEDTKEMSKLITEQKIRILKLEEEVDG